MCALKMVTIIYPITVWGIDKLEPLAAADITRLQCWCDISDKSVTNIQQIYHLKKLFFFFFLLL